MRCIVTRPRAQALPQVERLRAAGIDAVALPLIEIAPPADPAPVAAAWHAIRGQALVMFVSANAVERFFAAQPAGVHWPAAVRAGATGPGTTAALHAAGVPAAAIDAPAVPPFETEALWQQLRLRDWAGRQVLVVRGEQGRDWLAAQMRAAGATVRFVAAYARRLPQLDAAGRALLAQVCAESRGCAWLFSSAEAAVNLGVLAPAADWSAATALATHPRIAAAARRLGFGRVLDAPVLLPELIAQVRSLQSAPS